MGSGLKDSHPKKKYKKYKIATVFLTLALVSVLLVVVLFPVLFYKDLEAGDNNPVLDGMNVTKIWPAALISNNKNVTTEFESDQQPELIEENEEDKSEGSGGNALRFKRQDEPDDLLPDEQNDNESFNGNVDALDYSPRNVEDFSFGVGYGCVFISAIFILISVLIIICDQKKEEIYYKEISVELSEMQDVKE